MKYPQLVSMPSAVSDWLEEQLEARGIDAVVYTRYILSLFHRDSLDLFGSESDQRPEVRLGGSRKRLRRSAECCNHVHVDAEQLKRSAAVECLMSASDQNCGIETLVDELCEKLKEIESSNSSATDDKEKTLITGDESTKLSPSDLAKRYYAAFPPLSRTSTNLITLIPKWFGSPNKKKASRKNHIQKRSYSCDENLHSKSESEPDNMRTNRNVSKQRLSYFSRNKKELGYSRTMAKSLERTDGLADWDVYMYERNGTAEEDSKQLEANLAAKFDPSLEDLWKDEDRMDTYEGLPVDIQDLLASPSPQDVAVELLNWANKQDLNKRSFIQCGTNITSSIWSDNTVPLPSDASNEDLNFDKSLYEDLCNGTLEADFRGKFNLWSDDNDTHKQNESSFSYESFGEDVNPQWNFSYPIPQTEKWSDAIGDETCFKYVSDSLIKLNHNREFSCFKEVVPKITKPEGDLNQAVSKVNSQNPSDTLSVEEDLLTSAHSHFRPINSISGDASGQSNNTAGTYVDGTTFVISSNLDQINYKRSSSGALYLESETGGSPKKIMCYKNDSVNDAVGNDDEILDLLEPEFVLKFTPCLNDKSCQTDIIATAAAAADVRPKVDEMQITNAPAAAWNLNGACEPDDFFFPGDDELITGNLENYEFYSTRADSMTAEIIWDSGEKKCDKCKINDLTKNKNKAAYDNNKGRNIWNVEVCGDCLGVTAGRAPSGRSLQYCQLREELSQDGEQLLSDLSCLQRVYMENTTTDNESWQPCIEEENTASSWSNFTMVKKDCILEVPTLRSVTL